MRYLAAVLLFAASSAWAALDPWHPPVGASAVGLSLSDGWYDPRVLGVVNVDGGWTDSAQITGDGKYLLFAYSQYDFSTWLNTGAEVITGPPRLGQGPKFTNYVFDVVNNAFTLLPGNPSDAATFATSPGTNTTSDVYVQSWWVNGGGARLMVSFNNSGAWSSPAELPYPVNSLYPGCYADNGFAVGTKTAFRLYFESKRVNAAATSCGGKSRIWRTDYTTSGGYSAPVLVPGLSTSTSDDTQVSVSPDGATIYWTSNRNGVTGIFAGTFNGSSSLRSVHAVATVNYASNPTGRIIYVGEVTVAQSATIQLMYFMCGIAQDSTAKTVKISVCVARKGAA